MNNRQTSKQHTEWVSEWASEWVYYWWAWHATSLPRQPPQPADPVAVPKVYMRLKANCPKDDHASNPEIEQDKAIERAHS